MKLIVNGQEVIPATSLPYSLSLLRGDGLFETILVKDEKVIAWEQHYQRLNTSAETILISLPAKIDLEMGIAKLVKGCLGFSRMRLTVLSDGNWFISIQSEIVESKPIRLMRSETVKNSRASLSGLKSTSYGESLFSVRKVQALGFDDVIYVNENGHIVDTALANLLILKGGDWITPSLDTGCLPGITRGLLIKWFDVKEGSFTFDELLASPAILLTSSIRLIASVSKVGDQLFTESVEAIALIHQFKDQLFSNII